MWRLLIGQTLVGRAGEPDDMTIVRYCLPEGYVRYGAGGEVNGDAVLGR